MNGNETNQLVKGAFLLTLAGLISKLLSAGYRIPLQNLTGDIGFYVYQQVYPILGIIFVLSFYGFPSAISKMAVELKAQGKGLSLKSFYLPIGFILLLISGSLFLFLFFNASYISEWIGDEKLTSIYQLAAFTCLFVPFSALLRGVFQGTYVMKPTAYSQVAEQLIRVAIIIATAILISMNDYPLYHIGKAAVFASILGAGTAIIVLSVFFWRKKPYTNQEFNIPWNYYVRTILILGVAAALNHMVLLVIQFADTFTVIPSLLKAGLSKEAAMEAKGIFDRGQPLIQLGTILGSSFALALIPTISKKKLKHDPITFYSYIRGALLFSIYLAVGATIGLITIFPEVNRLLFQDNQSTGNLQLLMISILLSSISITAAAVLQGLGFIKRIAGFILIAFFVKWIANQVLIPWLGITGSAVATIISLLVLCTIVLRELRRKLPHLNLLKSLQWRPLFVAICAMALFVLCGHFIILPWLNISRIGLLVYVVFISIMGAALYGYCLIKLRAFSEQELRMLPFRTFLMKLQSRRK
ncbi:oligosaccharide flippase family protein [Virgibacillus sp. AGTR]|uniref:putative polysaccharide biosynthesis protein n=1 Tax=unclassified Virgibacillus TaxID=2620237 RepID=UPI0019633E8E|nr:MULTISPECIES: oligosaccharide flippase family protein [unclassified Virgibacillus]MCC2251860.1 oligosaccharide flippase family protein [Virgibacillus sp. AGTR]MDY7046155.1 oligosaccharide flippase family protein [Virgibacillus sp. M23]QRZ19099.1 oligosaccharide flippase family protein [Virgibacillus sp. AGTR]